MSMQVRTQPRDKPELQRHERKVRWGLMGQIAFGAFVLGVVLFVSLGSLNDLANVRYQRERTRQALTESTRKLNVSGDTMTGALRLPAGKETLEDFKEIKVKEEDIMALPPNTLTVTDGGLENLDISAADSILVNGEPAVVEDGWIQIGTLGPGQSAEISIPLVWDEEATDSK